MHAANCKEIGSTPNSRKQGNVLTQRHLIVSFRALPQNSHGNLKALRAAQRPVLAQRVAGMMVEGKITLGPKISWGVQQQTNRIGYGRAQACPEALQGEVKQHLQWG